MDPVILKTIMLRHEPDIPSYESYPQVDGCLAKGCESWRPTYPSDDSAWIQYVNHIEEVMKNG